MVRVLVVEDSGVSREFLSDLLRQDADVAVVGTASDGADAVQSAKRLKPDVILMDVHMPGMNGLEATREIMRSVPTPIVMMSANAGGSEARMTFDAIHAGALTFVNKPRGGADDAHAAGLFIAMVKAMAEVKVVRRWPAQQALRPALIPLPRPEREIRVIAMGASTGGPPALLEILRNLPAACQVPILLVQHITPGFAEGLAVWLDESSGFPIKLAQDGEPVASRVGYLAPDGLQMTVVKPGIIRLRPPRSGQQFCPSIDDMFASVAETYGPSALGVILTGMGRDGAAGLCRLREAGALTIAQDAATSAVFGMPKEAIRLNAATHVLPLHGIAHLMGSLAFAHAQSSPAN